MSDVQHVSSTRDAEHRRLLFVSDGLAARGIKFSRQHINRLMKAGKFPKPVKLGLNSNAWIASEVDEYIDGRIAERDAKQTRK